MRYQVPFNRPTASTTATAFLTEALSAGRLSGGGPFTRDCESILEKVSGARRALLTNSCTAALEASALLLDAQAGDEVVVPSFTFVSTANAFAVHGLRPTFADCRPDTLNVDVATLEPRIGPRTKAVVVMHYGGVACDMDDILTLARSRGLVVIEDNAHGLFGAYMGRPLGSMGSLATQSFHETKNVTCGEGGALLVNDESLIDRAEILREKGTNRSRFFRGEVDKYTWVDYGSNYLASELQAACLLGQLQAWESIQAKRAAVWSRYDAGLRDWAQAHGVGVPAVPAACAHPSHLYYLLLPTAAARPRLIERLRDRGILAVFHYVPLHTSPMGRKFGGSPGDCPVAEDISERLLRLPFYTDLSVQDQDLVIDVVSHFTA